MQLDMAAKLARTEQKTKTTYAFHNQKTIEVYACIYKKTNETTTKIETSNS